VNAECVRQSVNQNGLVDRVKAGIFLGSNYMQARLYADDAGCLVLASFYWAAYTGSKWRCDVVNMIAL